MSTWPHWDKSLCKIKECQKAKLFTLQMLFALPLSCNAYKTKKVMVRLKVPPIRLATLLFAAAGCSKPRKKPHFQDYFQCQRESKGPKGQLLLSKWWLLFASVCYSHYFFNPEKSLLREHLMSSHCGPPSWCPFSLPALGGAPAPSLNSTNQSAVRRGNEMLPHLQPPIPGTMEGHLLPSIGGWA